MELAPEVEPEPWMVKLTREDYELKPVRWAVFRYFFKRLFVGWAFSGALGMIETFVSGRASFVSMLPFIVCFGYLWYLNFSLYFGFVDRLTAGAHRHFEAVLAAARSERVEDGKPHE